MYDCTRFFFQCCIIVHVMYKIEFVEWNPVILACTIFQILDQKVIDVKFEILDHEDLYLAQVA